MPSPALRTAGSDGHPGGAAREGPEGASCPWGRRAALPARPGTGRLPPAASRPARSCPGLPEGAGGHRDCEGQGSLCAGDMTSYVGNPNDSRTKNRLEPTRRIRQSQHARSSCCVHGWHCFPKQWATRKGSGKNNSVYTGIKENKTLGVHGAKTRGTAGGSGPRPTDGRAGHGHGVGRLQAGRARSAAPQHPNDGNRKSHPPRTGTLGGPRTARTKRGPSTPRTLARP